MEGAIIQYWYRDNVTGVLYTRINSDVDVQTGTALTITPAAAEFTAPQCGTQTKDFIIREETATPRVSNNQIVTTPTFGAWATEIIGMVDWQEDFYGIILGGTSAVILGGTSAVSNKKRDDLDDIVKDTVRDANVYTVGGEAPDTVEVFSQSAGVNLKYSRLIPVATQVSNKAFGGAAANTRKADVYRVAGTNAYVLVMFNNSGDLIDWAYYPNGALEADYINWWK